jgi:peptidoglycan-N-acetylglucosamine deacetylase
MYLVKTPNIVKNILCDHIWEIPTDDKCVYLTFDDGPIPVVTPWVLDLLDSYGFKATFFCVGENIQKYPDIYRRILDEGHQIGNHTYNHLNGWVTDKRDYLDNIQKWDDVADSKLFRPPYGKLKPSQAVAIKQEKTIVMWDILSGDFDANITADQCLDNVTSNYKEGSIIVFHDNIKAFDKLKVVLPAFCQTLAQDGWHSAGVEVREAVLV